MVEIVWLSYELLFDRFELTNYLKISKSRKQNIVSSILLKNNENHYPDSVYRMKISV